MTIRDKALYIQQRMAKSKATINEINNLLQFGYYHTAINRIYYSCFYAVEALLTTVDTFPKSHKGILTMFSQHFIKTGKVSLDFGEFYSKLFQERLLADYAEESVYTKEFVERMLSVANLFIQHIEKLLEEK